VPVPRPKEAADMESAETEMAHAAAAAPHRATITRPGAGCGGGGGAGDEEEVRLWAALERLPTAQRARSAIVDDGACGKAVVDVGDLGLAQRRALLNRLVGSVDRDNERFLLKLRERIDRYVYGRACSLFSLDRVLELALTFRSGESSCSSTCIRLVTSVTDVVGAACVLDSHSTSHSRARTITVPLAGPRLEVGLRPPRSSHPSSHSRPLGSSTRQVTRTDMTR
jgi:hypothetical protein